VGFFVSHQRLDCSSGRYSLEYGFNRTVNQDPAIEQAYQEGVESRSSKTGRLVDLEVGEASGAGEVTA
jgi:hypothetical protein